MIQGVLKLFGAALISCTATFGATYYIDFSSGSDLNAGTSSGAPWKHCPGDPNATQNAIATTLIPGDTVVFKGGIKYAGRILATASGTQNATVTYKGSSDWGTGKAIIDGSMALAVQPCTGLGTQNGQVPNTNYASIYVAPLPSGADWTLPVFESDAWLTMAQSTRTNPDAFFYRDTEYFDSVSNGLTVSSCTDPSRLNQTDPSYWTGAHILVHITGNEVADAEILSFDPSTHSVTFPTLPKPPYADLNWDSMYHYTIVNSPRLLNGPGQYAIDESARLIYVWPRVKSDAITVGTQPFGFSTNGKSFLTIDGFVIQGQYGTTYQQGRAVTAGSVPTDGIIISNCDIRNHVGNGASGATYIYGAGNALSKVENCTFSDIYGRGPFITGARIAVINCHVNHITQTCIYSQNPATSTPNTDGEISGNTIDNCRGVHQNGITVYGGSSAPAKRWTIHNNVIRHFSQRYGNFGMSAQLHGDFLIYNNLVEADGGYAGDPMAIGTSYFLMYNNTFVPATIGGAGGKVRILGLSNCARTEFFNNICNGLFISDASSSGPYDWRNIAHTNNLYTTLTYLQYASYATNTTGAWQWGPSEAIATPKDLFLNAGAGDYRLSANTNAAVDTATDLSSLFTNDVEGNPRPIGPKSDIGAYERQFSAAPVLSQAPLNGRVRSTSRR